MQPQRAEETSFWFKARLMHLLQSCVNVSPVINRVEHSFLSLSIRYRVVVPYPPQSEAEIELKAGDIVFVHKKREDGWYKGTLQRTGRTGLFPSSFVESF